MKREKSKNLIVIVGNGFDLAHGLKTSFNDFADYYIKNIVLNDILNYETEPKILSESFINRLIQSQHFRFPAYENLTKEKIFHNFLYDCKEKNKDEILYFISENYILLKQIISNEFLAKLYTDNYLNWFNIEQAYYAELNSIYLSNNNSNLINHALVKLNKELQEIKYAFQEYLFTNIKSFEDKNIYNSLKEHFKERNQVCFINFNYTYSVEQYYRLEKDDNLKKTLKRIKNIHIHGQMQTDIIFGYGDDTDNAYKLMKNSREKEYLRNFKTFDYLIKTEYREMLNELAVYKNYDVLVIGHSLDTTDKTILKTILDTPKCNNIELLKRSDLKNIDEEVEYHFELHANLSRIFENEKDLREKVIPFLRSVNFPIMMNEDFNIIHDRERKFYIKKEPLNLGAPSIS